jgi:hypothetical protein
MVTVTAAGCAVVKCYMQGATSATALYTTGISLSSAANYFTAAQNDGDAVTGTPTAWLATTGTAAAAGVKVISNTVRMPMAAAGTPVLDFTSGTVTPPKDWLIAENNFSNLTAASTVVIKGVAAATGHIVWNNLETVNGAAATAITTPGNCVMYDNKVAQAGKQSIAVTVGGNST